MQWGTALMGGVGGDGRCVFAVIECPQYCHRDGLPWWAGCMVRAVRFCQRRVRTRPLGNPHAARIEAHRASGGGERGGGTVGGKAHGSRGERMRKDVGRLGAREKL